MLSKIRFPRLRLPVLTSSEKFALLTLTALLVGGAALRLWERSGIRLGPVDDWATLRRLVVQARLDLDKKGDAVEFACADDAVAGSFGTQNGSGPEIVAAGFGGGGGPSRTKKGAAGDSRKKTPARPVDLNAAGEKALLILPGVGPSTAKAIVAYRAAHGRFRSVEELLQVKGIGPKKLESLRPFLRVDTAVGVRVESGGQTAEKTETSAAPAGTPPKSP
jgi:competence ComEA-like helix-hairpin-helix protein